MRVTNALKTYFRKKIEKNPEKYKDIKKTLESSRLKITLAELLSSSILYALIAMVFGWFLFYIGLIYAGNLLNIYFIYFFEIELWQFQIAITTIFSILIFSITRYLILAYPYYVANSRKGKIDSSLPHAVNMMLGMVKGNVPLISAFKFIAENRTLFGEVSVEFERISVLAELGDLESAIRYVADTTPSEKLKFFLENLIDVYRGSGSVINYLKAKSEQFFMEKERNYTIFVESMQILAEIYLTLFIVAPLFLLIILVVFNLLGASSFNLYRIFAYTMLPIGSLIVLWIAHSSSLKESREFRKVVIEKEHINAPISQRRPNFRFKKLKRVYNSIKNFLLYPVFEEPYVLEIKHIAFYFLTPGLIFFLIFYDKMEFDYLLFSTFLAIGIPLVFFVEYRERLIKRAEKELPEFLKQFASLNEAGLNVIEVLKNIGDSKASLVSKEIKIIKRELEWGELVTKAFLKLEKRIRSGIFQKAISMLVKAIEVSPSIKDALYTASIFSTLEIEIRERLRGIMSTYLIIIYLAFGVFLYTTFVLMNNMFSVLASTPSQFAYLDLIELEKIFMETSLLIAIFSGLAGGIMGEGRVEAGLKHIFLLLMITYVFFKFVV
ncbi:MAG: type II secretion system F family protein [Archaeoglobaceae archaeon]|nr:type II secretion system F family protein [Archaeoglobaceae archaeon]MDW7990061.1 type II secretion system F family protein [Archaeoglobaceae archaeon]